MTREECEMPARHLTDLILRDQKQIPWETIQPNFPWNDPVFSKRMLREHLDDSHDLATRRTEMRNKSINWLEETLFKNRGVKTILDLTCGPGLISNELARRKYTVKGIDFSPASIDYARATASDEGLSAAYVQGDILETGFGAGYDAALFIWGQPNCFRWEEFAIIMLRIKEALNPGGIVVIEFDTIERMSAAVGTSWNISGGDGLFASEPYIQLNQNIFNAENNSAASIFHIIDPETARVREFSVCMQAYTLQDLEPLLLACGMKIIDMYPSMTGDENDAPGRMMVIVAERLD